MLYDENTIAELHQGARAIFSTDPPPGALTAGIQGAQQELSHAPAAPNPLFNMRGFAP